MDKRVERTQKAIFSAYVELASKKKKITIKEICEIANINKSTFYRNFLDLADLQHKITENISDYIINNFKSIDLLYEDTKKFILDFALLILEIVERNNFDIQISKISSLIMTLTIKFKDYYTSKDFHNFNFERSIFVTGGIIAFLERNGDVLLSVAVKDLLNNIDFISKYTSAVFHYN